MKIQTGSVMVDWWEKYLAADILKRQELIANLPFVKSLVKDGFPDISKIEEYKNLSKEELAQKQEFFNNHILTTMLLSYFEDLIELKNIS